LSVGTKRYAVCCRSPESATQWAIYSSAHSGKPELAMEIWPISQNVGITAPSSGNQDGDGKGVRT